VVKKLKDYYFFKNFLYRGKFSQKKKFYNFRRGFVFFLFFWVLEDEPGTPIFICLWIASSPFLEPIFIENHFKKVSIGHEGIVIKENIENIIPL